jgi:ribonuclease G
VSAGETRVAIVEQNTFTELHIERERERSVASMVVKGRVTRVLPGMQAAFVDIGLEKAAFLYVGDYLDDQGQLDPDMVEDEPPRPRRGRGRNAGRPPPQIETLLREGQEVIVQVAKEPIGTKGARITSHVSIAGRHLVLTPWSQRVGVSRRIESDRERRRLREIVTRLRPRDVGFIIRTAGEGAREADLEADVKYLSSVWDEIKARRDEVIAPARLSAELSLPLRTIRDFANSRTRRITIDDPETHEEMKSFISRFVADPKPRLELYSGTLPIFDHFGLETRIDDNLGKKVWLKSGGYLIVDQSEALTAIDVNTGRYVGKRDLEETVLKTNLEAVQEVVHQLRFRNIGGLIIIDLIDMETAENREKVYRALQDALRQDKAKTNILKISELGLVEMTRKRTRENLVQQLCEPCSYCEGRGYVISAETVAFKVLREIRKDLPRFCGRQIAVAVNPRVAEMLLGSARKATQRLTEELGREIEIRARPGIHQEQFEVTALDEGPPVALSLRWLEDRSEEAAAELPEPVELVPPELADREVEDRPETPEPTTDEAPELASGGPPAGSEQAAPTAQEEGPPAAVEPEPSAGEAPEEPPLAGPETDAASAMPSAKAGAEAEGAPAVDAEAESPILPRSQDTGER